MPLRRGFKSEAERIARRTCEDLGLEHSSSVNPEELAGQLGIEVRAGDDVIPRKQFEELHEIQPGAFSACTFRFPPDRLVVVFNPLSSRARRTSDIAHELSHILLDHKLSRVERLGDATFLSCDPAQEEEANWLSGCLLLPRPLLLDEIRKGNEAVEIARQYNVSEDMAKYRLNVTGVMRQQKAR